MALSAVETSLLTTEFGNYIKSSIVMQSLFQAAGIPAGESAKASDVTTLITTILAAYFNQTTPVSTGA